jgi:hypothetical protein
VGLPPAKLKVRPVFGAFVMRSSKALPLIAFLLCAVVVPLSAQHKDDDRWQIGLENGDFIWDIRLLRLAGDSLIFSQADTLGSVSVQKVKELRLIRKTEVHLGEGGGSVMAALTGTDDEVFDLNTLDYPARLRTIQQAFLLHPPRP